MQFKKTYSRPATDLILLKKADDKKMEPAVGVEPTTIRLQGERSTN